MEKGICSVSVAPLREEPAHQSEMVSQILYGESVDFLEVNGSFAKVKMHFDQYTGWVDMKQISEISEQDFAHSNNRILTESFGIHQLAEGKMLLSMGSEIPSDQENSIPSVTRERIFQ
ncbi:MAG: SH3 domain-containing protein, partial [Kaistella sp.]